MAGLIALLLALVVSACGSEEGFVEIVNDLERPVEVLHCDNNLCSKGFHFRDNFPPGASFQASVSTSGVPNPGWFESSTASVSGAFPS